MTEDYPPECEKLPTEFGFREFGNIHIENGEGKWTEKVRHSLLAVANIYGLAFVGCLDGVKVFLCEQLLDNGKEKTCPESVASVPLRSAPHWVAVSSDNLTLAVCSNSDKGLQVLFFDTRNFVNKTKSTKTPFAVHLVSKSAQHVVDMHWNPSQENAQYLAICVSDGTFQILSVKDNVQEIAKKSTEFGACAVCWSPRGKQMMVGRRDGSIQQYTPAMEIRRTVPVCENVGAQMRVCDVLWVSTLQVMVAYVAVTEDTGNEERNEQPNLFLANLPSAKEQDKTVKWISFDDPCYGSANPQASHFQTSYVDKWNMFVLASSKASETAVLGKSKENIWEIWNLDDSCRAQLPMQEDTELLPLGSAVIYTAKKRIIVDDTRESGPMPVYAMLSNEGHLCLFHMINLQSVEEYPNLIVEAKQLLAEGERSAVPSNSGSLDAASAKPLMTPSGKQKLVSKPSILMKTSTPKLNLGVSQENNTSQLSLTPVQGFQQPQKPLPDEKAARGVSPVAKSLTNTFTMLKNNPGFMRLPESPVPSTPDHDVTSGMQQPPQLVTAPQLSKTNSSVLRVEATKSQTPPTIGTNSPFKVPQPMSQPPHEVQPQAPINRVSSLQSLNEVTPGSAEKLKRKQVIGKTRERVNSLQSVEADVLADSLRSEIMDFDQELTNFLQESSSIDRNVASLDEEINKSAIKRCVEDMSKFRDDIKKTTSDQHEEIQTGRTHFLEMYSALKNLEMRKERMENPAYRNALYSRPLDLDDQRKMKEIQASFQYVREAIKQTNAALDDQWHKFQQNQKSSSLRKSKRRMQLEETDMITRVVQNQMQILHKKERVVMELSQQIDRLKLLRNSAMQSTTASFYKQSKLQESFTAPESADLSTLADVLIHQQTPKPQTQAERKESPLTKISPLKTSQLSQMLGNRKTTPVRATSGPRSSILMPPITRRGDKTTTESVSQKSEYSQSSSFTTEESGGYQETTPSEGSITGSESSESTKENRGAFQTHQFLPSQKDAALLYSNRNTLSPKPGSALLSGPQFPGVHKPLAKMNTILQQNMKPFGQAVPQPVLHEPPKALIKPGENSAQQGTSAHGSSTISYGGPKHETPHLKPISFVEGKTEAASNLNNPPQVVNIKDLKEPTNPNIVPFSSTFKPRPDVPPGAATEMQRVLNTVVAERQKTDQQHPQAMSMLPQKNVPSAEQTTPNEAAKTAQGSALTSLLMPNKPVVSAAEVSKPAPSVFGNLTNTSSLPFSLPNFPAGSSSFHLSLPGSSKLGQPTSSTTQTTTGGNIPGLSTQPSNIFKPTEKINIGGFSLNSKGSASSPAVFDLLKNASSKPDESKDRQDPAKSLEPEVQQAPPNITPTTGHSNVRPQLSDPQTEPPARPKNEPPPLQKAPTPVPVTTPMKAPTPTPQETPPVKVEPQKDINPPTAVATLAGSAQGQAEPPTASQGVEGQREIVEEAPGAAFAPKSTTPVSLGFGFGITQKSSGVFTSPATSAVSPPVFGQKPNLGGFSSLGQTTPQTTSSSGSVFGTNTTASSGFGGAPPFGSVASGAPSGGSGFGFGSGGGFMSGLGSTVTTTKPASNPFASEPSSSATNTQSSSLFGTTGASAFGQSPQPKPEQSAFASSTPQTYNAFSKPATGGFGSPPAFGASAFGAKPVFGSTSQFSSPTTGFGTAAAFSSPPGLAAATTSAGHVFGSMSTGSGFGSFGNQTQSSGFGALASQNTGGFGQLAQQSPTGFGSQSGGFGSSGTMSSGFGSAGSGGFGSAGSGGFGNAGAGSGGFGSAGSGSGGFGSTGTGSGGFGSTAQPAGFGSAASQGGFGSAASQGGFGSFGGSGTSAGFGAAQQQPQQSKPSFSGWRS